MLDFSSQITKSQNLAKNSKQRVETKFRNRSKKWKHCSSWIYLGQHSHKIWLKVANNECYKVLLQYRWYIFVDSVVNWCHFVLLSSFLEMRMPPRYIPRYIKMESNNVPLNLYHILYFMFTPTSLLKGVFFLVPSKKF